MNAGGEICSLIFAILFVPAVILGWLNILHSLRMRRVRRMYESLAPEVRRRVLDRIDQAGRDRTSCLVLVASKRASGTSVDVCRSRYGGAPYAEAGDTWPAASAEKPDPADFLIQVRLDSLPPPWSDRLVVVFNRFDTEQTARSYASPSAERAVTLSGGPAPQVEWDLERIHIPPQAGAGTAESDQSTSSGLLDYDPVVLLKEVPGLKEDLDPITRRPADLLAAVIAPNHCGYGFELSDVVQVSGGPVWLLGAPEEITCVQCGRAMRFLFQFGDLNGGVALGSSGVCYVFGCDDHPESPRAVAQMC